MIEIVSKIGMGMVAGVAYSMSHFAKKEGQSFDWLKFVSTIGFGAVIGLVHGVLGLDLGVANELLVNAGAVPLVENVCKAFWRKLMP